MAGKSKLDVTKQLLSEIEDMLPGIEHSEKQMAQLSFCVLSDIAMSLARISDNLHEIKTEVS